MALNPAAKLADTRNAQAPVVDASSASEAEWIAMDMEKHERLEGNLWLFERAVLGAEVALRNGVPEDTVVAAFGQAAAEEARSRIG